MIWDKLDCPLCGLLMLSEHSVPADPMHIIRCPTAMDCPSKYLMKLRASAALDAIKSHFEVEYQNFKPVYQVLRIFPFCIKSYNTITNIYKFDENMNQHFVVETDYLELPWNDQEKIVKKLSTYTLFS